MLTRLDDDAARRLARVRPGPERSGWSTPTCGWPTCSGAGDQTYVIDFDDCGFGWFLYDFGAAVSFFEHDPRGPRADRAWVEGYRRVARCPPRTRPRSDVRHVPPAAAGGVDRLARRAVDVARESARTYTAGSCDLAEEYLSATRLTSSGHDRGGPMFTSLEGRSVVVTGGSKGIGKGIAAVFAAPGAKVLVVGRDERRLRPPPTSELGRRRPSAFSADVAEPRRTARRSRPRRSSATAASTCCARTPASSPTNARGDDRRRTSTRCSAPTSRARCSPCRPACRRSRRRDTAG